MPVKLRTIGRPLVLSAILGLISRSRGCRSPPGATAIAPSRIAARLRGGAVIGSRAGGREVGASLHLYAVTRDRRVAAPRCFAVTIEGAPRPHLACAGDRRARC